MAEWRSPPICFAESRMDLDAKVCYCFHVTQRKLLNYLRVEKPRVAS